jgi:hypothetical protein
MRDLRHKEEVQMSNPEDKEWTQNSNSAPKYY